MDLQAIIRRSVLPVAAVAGVAALTGCGTSSPSTKPTAPLKSSQAAHSLAPSTSQAAAARANERALAYWIASSARDPSAIASAISGPVMRIYVRHEALLAEADAAAGSPDTPGTVSGIPGGWQVCWTDSSNGTSCNSATEFHTNAAGRITDFAVDGRLVSPRLAIGTTSTGSDLAISDVSAYVATTPGEVLVTYKARNITSHVVGNGNPAFLAVFDPSGGGQFQEDDNWSTLPSNLQPGESVVEYAAFGTRTVTGHFSLRSNDGYESMLATSTLRPLHAPKPAPGTATARPSASAARAVRLACKVLQTNTGEEFNVTTVGGGSYRDTVYVSFFGPAGSGEVFPNTTVNGASPAGAWHQVPAADIGASAEPSSCTASTG